MGLRMRVWRCIQLGCGATLLSFGACARVQDSLDLLLSPGSVGNALRLPYSSAAGIARLLGEFIF
jgi:hypothetical protein